MRDFAMVCACLCLLAAACSGAGRSAAEWVPSAVTEYFYDAEGRLVRQAWRGRDIRDGQLWLVITTYDAEGRRVCVTRDEGADGEVESWTTTAYDEAGFEIFREELHYGIASSTRFFYDRSGRLAAEEEDAGKDGHVDVTVSYTYDQEGRLQAQARDHAADGTVDHQIRYHYDHAGRLTAILHDRGADGEIDLRIAYAPTPAGTPASATYTRGRDGRVTMRVDYAYDNTGRLLRSDCDGCDGSPAEGTLDRRIEYSYGDDGALIREVSLDRPDSAE